MGGRRGTAEEELMTRPEHVCPNEGCRGYALGSDDEQEGAQHHRRRGDDALDIAPKLLSSAARKRKGGPEQDTWCCEITFTLCKRNVKAHVTSKISHISSSHVLQPYRNGDLEKSTEGVPDVCSFLRNPQETGM